MDEDHIYPGISIVIPTYNCERIISRALDSIMAQDYPINKVEVLIVDDLSNDSTIEIASRYPIKILKNGKRNIEVGKSIGLHAAIHEFILFLDADNVLSGRSSLKSLITPLMNNPDMVGTEPIYFSYQRSDPAANRYCSLFGINDVLAYYLGRRDRLMATERSWNLAGHIEDKGNYYLAEFDKDEIPTLGSIGFMTRKSLVLQTNCSPFFFHIDSNATLIENGFNKYGLVKIGIIHNHCDGILMFLKKELRNIRLYFLYKNLRRYKWISSRKRLLSSILQMMTVIGPTRDSVTGYKKIPDYAWFYNIFLCPITLIIYGMIVSMKLLARE